MLKLSEDHSDKSTMQQETLKTLKLSEDHSDKRTMQQETLNETLKKKEI